jgi:hypothetical protein
MADFLPPAGRAYKRFNSGGDAAPPQGVELAGFLREEVHATTLPVWRGLAPSPLFPRAAASAIVPTGRESAETAGVQLSEPSETAWA